MMHYAGEDARINGTIPEFRTLLDEFQVAYCLHRYPGTGHGFHNDSSAARDNEAARNAILGGVDAFDHGFDLDDELLKLMKKHGTYLIGTDQGHNQTGSRWAFATMCTVSVMPPDLPPDGSCGRCCF